MDENGVVDAAFAYLTECSRDYGGPEWDAAWDDMMYAMEEYDHARYELAIAAE